MSLASAYEAAGRLRESILHQVQRAIIATFRAGPVPRHVAFVMDGNRRYARSQGKHVFEGHLNGFYALRRVCTAFRPTHCELSKPVTRY